MKNILAENLIRFRAKNLKETDRKKIEETVLAEDIKINNIVYKYPFKDANQLNQYMSLMAFTVPTPQLFGINPNDYEKWNTNTQTALKNIQLGLMYETAIEGILPSWIPTNLAHDIYKKLETLRARNLRYEQQTSAPNLGSAEMSYIKTVLEWPNFQKWYLNKFKPQWQNAYEKTFMSQPNTNTTAVAPKN